MGATNTYWSGHPWQGNLEEVAMAVPDRLVSIITEIILVSERIIRLRTFRVNFDHSLQFLSGRAETAWDDSRRQFSQSFGIGFFNFLPEGAVVARPLISQNRFTACSIHPIWLKVGRMILCIRPHCRSQSDFCIPFQGALRGRAS